MDAADRGKMTFLYAGAAVTVLLAILVCWAATGPTALESVKELTVNVEHSDGTTFLLEFKTTARYLAEALEPYELIDGIDTETGLYITEVDGESAAGYNGRSWVWVINGDQSELPIESQPVEDGDSITFYTEIN